MTETANKPEAAPETSQAPLARRGVPVAVAAAREDGIACATCFLYFAPGKPGFGVCKRYPPEPIRPGGVSAAKTIRDTDWCGEHPEIQAAVRGGA